MKPYKLLKTTIETHCDVLGRMVAVAIVEPNDPGNSRGDAASGIVLFEYADNPLIERELRQVQAFFGGAPVARGEHPVFEQLHGQLQAYLRGDLPQGFSVPLRPVGTPFQLAVWEALPRVPYGQTISYGQQAQLLGLSARWARAVARANGQNKLPILLPCHRIIGHRGTLTGYSGGLPRKAFLLSLESS